MARVPKEIREVQRSLKRSRYEVVRRTKHYAVVERATGQVVMTLHGNQGNRAHANQLAALKRKGVLA